MRGGKDCDSSFAHRMKGEGAWAQLLSQRFAKAVRRLRLSERQNGVLDVSHFRRLDPQKPANEQLNLF